MSRKAKETTLGFYLPSFIRMHIGTDLSLSNLNTLDDETTEATYIHEYTHFIQDITTAYGYFNTYVIGEYMRMANHSIIASAPGAFTVPVEAIPADPDNVYANQEMADFLSGSGNDDDVTLTNHRLRPANVITSGAPLPIEIVEIEYSNGYGSIELFDFGELCISESMAYLLEMSCYPNCPASPDLPYSSAQALVQMIYPAFGTEVFNILALCDLSLLQQNPGKFFYDTLLHFQANKLTFNAPEDIYTWCYNQPDFSVALNHFAPLAQQHLTTYLNGGIFTPLNNWLSRMLTNGLNYRNQNRTFILDIARGGRIKDNNAFKRFFTTIGTPLVTNTFGETTLFNPNTSENLNYSLILALDQINSVLWLGKRNCDLVGVCCSQWHTTLNICNSKKPKVDLRCATEPWLRAEDQNLCPFATVWRHWQLTGYYPED